MEELEACDVNFLLKTVTISGGELIAIDELAWLPQHSNNFCPRTIGPEAIEVELKRTMSCGGTFAITNSWVDEVNVVTMVDLKTTADNTVVISPKRL
jgi:hypothetical protein